MIYQESIGEAKTTYDGTPEEIAELYSGLNLQGYVAGISNMHNVGDERERIINFDSEGTVLNNQEAISILKGGNKMQVKITYTNLKGEVNKAILDVPNSNKAEDIKANILSGIRTATSIIVEGKNEVLYINPKEIECLQVKIEELMEEEFGHSESTREEGCTPLKPLNTGLEFVPDKPNIFNPVDNAAAGIKAVSQKLKEQSEPININITVSGEVDSEKFSKELEKAFKEVTPWSNPYFAKEGDPEIIKVSKDKEEIKLDPLNNIKRLVTNDNFEYEIGYSDVEQIKPVLSNSGDTIMYLLVDKEDNVICGIPSCSIRKIFF